MRVTLIEVFVDDAGIVQHQVAVDQRRRLVIRIQFCQISGSRFVFRNINDFDINAFLGQHESDPVTVQGRLG
jgi:hypothetical protein